jgi:CubicO group peptidase (beta-lactamase class C family)
VPLSVAIRAACDSILTDAGESGRLPGVVASVFRRDEQLWTAGFGATASQYRVGSITKTFTAVALLRLREEGLLDLDDPLGRHLPDASFPTASLRDLLAHRSGLTAEPTGPWWERSPGVPWPELAAANRSAARVFPPHARYHYSNLGYALLGQVVARHRAMSWYEVVRHDLLAPLGLNATTYHPLDDAAQGTSRDPRSGDLVAEPAFDSVAMAPAGQLWSTVSDLARWGNFLLGGAAGIASASVMTEMRTAQSADADTQHVGAYGLGLRLRWRQASTLVGHTGSMPGFLAALFADPVSGIGAVVLTNATTGVAPEQLAVDLIEAAEQELGSPVAPAERAAAPTAASAELAGEWYWGNTPLRALPVPDGFQLHGPNGTVTFQAVEPDGYRGVDGYYAGEHLRVVRRGDGSVSHLEVVTFVFTRLPYDGRAPIPGGPPRRLSSPG